MSRASHHIDLYPSGRLGLFVQRVVDDTELPMFSRQLLELLALSLEEPTAARRLVQLVGEDYALTCRVLQVANSVHYNRSNRPIDNLSRAIIVLGMGTVQNLASALLCFESSKRRAVALRQLMTASMVSAQVAKVAAEAGGLPDRDGAYLAGMLRNLGEVLVAHHTPEQYAAIQDAIESGGSRDAVAVQVLGFTFDQLARVVARHWRLSPNVCAVWDPDVPSSELTAAARFANELTQVMCYDTDARREAGTALLAMRYGWTLQLAEQSIADVWDRALDETRTIFENLGMSLSLFEEHAAPTQGEPQAGARPRLPYPDRPRPGRSRRAVSSARNSQLAAGRW